MGWRYQVARPAVEGCATHFSFKCPREWSAMTETDRKDVRHCSACNKHVYYAATVESARRHVAAGACVVVDILPRRAHQDLRPEPIRMAGAMAVPSMPRPDVDVPSARNGGSGTLFLIYNSQRYPVTKDPVEIGIGPAGLAIGILSHGHAVVIRRNGTFYIKDLSESLDYRGMRIDNKRIDEGDVFHVGDHELRFTYRAG
jgi:hypothetical protein